MSINRRELIKMSGLSAAGLVFTSSNTRLTLAEKIVPGGLVDLSGNENPYGPASVVAEALSKTIEAANRYEYARQKELVKQIAEHEGDLFH